MFAIVVSIFAISVWATLCCNYFEIVVLYTTWFIVDTADPIWLQLTFDKIYCENFLLLTFDKIYCEDFLTKYIASNKENFLLHLSRKILPAATSYKCFQKKVSAPKLIFSDQ